MGKEDCSFLKKRTKRLLRVGCSQPTTMRWPSDYRLPHATSAVSVCRLNLDKGRSIQSAIHDSYSVRITDLESNGFKPP
jgi:hypothetical protein